MNSVIYSIPLSIISSAVAIPSAASLLKHQKEFVIYESTFSDILGVIDDSDGVSMMDVFLGEEIIRRQDSPICFDITTTGYVCNPNYILNNSNLFSGKIGGYELPKDRSIDIDDHVDFHIAEALFKNNE